MIKKISGILLLALIQLGAFAQATLEFNSTDEGKAISENLIGAFFEDINYGIDGGLYAELVENRSFEYYPVKGYVDLEPLHAWSIVRGVTAHANFSIEDSQPLNTHNTHYLKLTLKNADTGAGIANTGFGGMAITAGALYDFSVYVRSEAKFKAPLSIRLVSSKNEVLAETEISGISTEWQKYEATLKAAKSDSACQLQLITTGDGTLYFDMVSLFPQDTYKGRKNGLRQDLAQAIADIHPKFLRFPGGCISHGAGLDNAYRWKETVGDVAERTPNWNTWGYHQTYGVGFYEYFLFAEDMGATALPVVPVGISCQFRDREIAPMAEMGPWIDDAIDLIEFANGDASTTWGKVRADMGHPEPFNMQYICLGNEEDDIPEFRERYQMFVDSIRKYHPEIQIIGTSGPFSAGTDYDSHWDFCHATQTEVVDEHYYNAPEWFLYNNERYDDFDRKGPKVFIGEYASRDDKLFNAIAEAAYLTGIERNGDVIEFASYAPLLCKAGNTQWHPDMIQFSNTAISLTASYYVQQLFGTHEGDRYLNSSISYAENQNVNTTNYQGQIGLGTWSTQAEFDDLKVVSDGKVLVEQDFNETADQWQVVDGQFKAKAGSYVQSAKAGTALSIFNLPVEADSYTITLRAKKTAGDEGFLIPFAYQDAQNYYWLNIGGWGNTQHGMEKTTNGSKAALATATGSIENGVWYKIKIEVSPEGAAFYLNDELLFDIPVPEGHLNASVSKDTKNNELIVKLVNSGETALSTHLKIAGLTGTQEVSCTTLTGQATDRNSLAHPETIRPVESTISISADCELMLPAYSLKVFRVKL